MSTTHRRFSSRVAAAVAIAFLVCSDLDMVYGQRFRGVRPLPLRGRGEVQDLRPGFIRVKNEQGDLWLMKIEALPEMITLEGTVDRKFLKKGMFARLTAVLNEKGLVEKPVTDLTIFTPHRGLKLGLTLEKELETAENQKASKRRRRARKGRTRPGEYLVAGRLASIGKDGAIVIDASGRKVRAQLSPDAKVKLNIMGDYSLVGKGDTVEYRGKYYLKGEGVLNYVAFQVKEAPKPEAKKAAKRSTNSNKAAPNNGAAPKKADNQQVRGRAAA